MKNTKSTPNVAVGTVKKSIEMISLAWSSRNVCQLSDGGICRMRSRISFEITGLPRRPPPFHHPAQPEALSVPPDDRFCLDDRQGLPPVASNPRKQNPKESVHPLKAWLLNSPLWGRRDDDEGPSSRWPGPLRSEGRDKGAEKGEQHASKPIDVIG
jgi:hypothetical protein